MIQNFDEITFLFLSKVYLGYTVYQSKIGTTLLDFVSFIVYHSNTAILCITENYHFAAHLSNLILWTTTRKKSYYFMEVYELEI